MNTGTILQSKHGNDETKSHDWRAHPQPITLTLSSPPLYYAPWTLWNVAATLSWYHGVSWLTRHRFVLKRPSQYCQQNSAWHNVWRQITVQKLTETLNLSWDIRPRHQISSPCRGLFRAVFVTSRLGLTLGEGYSMKWMPRMQYFRENVVYII